jgi:ABC-type antimicrobial peptide transport system permease subunit
MNRPVGYSREGLINVNLATDDIAKHFEAFRNDCKQSGLVSEVALATSPTVYVTNNTGGLNWQGKDPNMPDDFANIGVSPEYGATVGWQFVAGRDFSRSWLTDSLALILNEAAVKYMGFKNPIGQTVKWSNRDFHVVGVIKDMVMQSPYEPVKQSLFYMRQKFTDDYVNIRIAPTANASQAITAIAAVYKRYSPATPFTYHFADLQYAGKFKNENRIGKLASIFSILAIFISCLGLFGMASFMAEQRVKEIGVRKVLGASVFNLWKMLSKDFIALVVIALVIALPLAAFLMDSWLQHYKYRAQMPWWVFTLTALGAILITLLTISYQGIRAALANPVKSLRSE